MIRVYVGWDPRDAVAFEVCRKTLLDHSSIPLTIIPLKDWELRRKGVYWRPYRVDERGQRWDDRDGKPFSTDFSFTRFCIPILEEYKSGPVLFCDPDMLWHADIAELLDLYDPTKAVQCVQHDHRPPETEKGVGLQTVYHGRIGAARCCLTPAKCEHLTKYQVNNATGQWLHTMCWAAEEDIGALPEEYNWLEGWSSPEIEPRVIHFTRGTPDMPGYENVDYAAEWNAERAKLGLY